MTPQMLPAFAIPRPSNSSGFSLVRLMEMALKTIAKGPRIRPANKITQEYRKPSTWLLDYWSLGVRYALPVVMPLPNPSELEWVRLFLDARLQLPYCADICLIKYEYISSILCLRMRAWALFCSVLLVLPVVLYTVHGTSFRTSESTTENIPTDVQLTATLSQAMLWHSKQYNRMWICKPNLL